jgi:hypothetical protein
MNAIKKNEWIKHLLVLAILVLLGLGIVFLRGAARIAAVGFFIGLGMTLCAGLGSAQTATEKTEKRGQRRGQINTILAHYPTHSRNRKQWRSP